MSDDSTDIVPYVRPTQPVIHPTTGEIVALDAPTDVLAEHILDVRDLEGALRSHKAAVTRELLNRMDTAATWTVKANRLKVAGVSPFEEVYDGEALWNGLHSIARDVGLAPESIEAAITEERVYKVSKRGLNQLRKLGGEVAKIIDRCKTEQPRKYRRVTVSVDR